MFRYLLFLICCFSLLNFTEASLTIIPTHTNIAVHKADIGISSYDTLIPTKRTYSKPVAVFNHASKKAKDKNAVAPVVSEYTALVSTKTIAICKGNGYFTGGKPRFLSGIFRDTLSSYTGRDSIVITQLSVLDCQSI